MAMPREAPGNVKGDSRARKVDHPAHDFPVFEMAGKRTCTRACNSQLIGKQNILSPYWTSHKFIRCYALDGHTNRITRHKCVRYTKPRRGNQTKYRYKIFAHLTFFLFSF